MTTSRVARISPSWALPCSALCSAILTLCACKHDPDPVAAYVAGTERLQDALCSCDQDSFECKSTWVSSACEQRVMHEHVDAIGSWLSCAADQMHSQAECVRESGCSDKAIAPCEPDLADACGATPNEAFDGIDFDLDRLCIDHIGCADGTTTNGRFCNGAVECGDRSDETGCDGSSSGSVDPGTNVQPSQGPAGKPIPVAPPDPIEGAATPALDMCVAATPTSANINPSCVHCGCRVASIEMLACDEVCWALIECVLAQLSRRRRHP